MTSPTHDPSHNVLALFEAQAAATPDATALVWNDTTYTYGQLNACANQWARFLQTLGGHPELPVGVSMRRSPEMICAVLGVVKAGGAYVPMDPTYPLARKQFMARDAGLQIVLTDAAGASTAWGAQVEPIVVGPVGEWQHAQSAENLNVAVTPSSLLYVHYTSGSTGTPKGVCGTHQQLHRRLEWLWRTYPMAETDVACHKAPLHFVDASLEIFGTLLQGRPLVIVPEEAATNPDALLPLLAETGVTRIFLVVSHLRLLLLAQPRLGDVLPALALCVVSGERLSLELVREFQAGAPDATLVNLYGCTEVPEISYLELVRDCALAGDDVPIGRPLPGTQLYLLDETRQPVPTGAVGELVVGSPLMARGYLHREDADARFIENPFAAGDANAAPRLYCTGDRVRRTPDGLLHYVGRADHQVKIRGYRVDLHEVEAALLAADSTVTLCAAVVLSDPVLAENKQIVAFVAPHTVDPLRLLAQLRDRLPSYMVPLRIFALAQFPLTRSGKVDRQALLAHAQPAPVSSGSGPESTEQIVARAWQAVLRLESPDRDRNFFEAGGNSLLLAQLYQTLVGHFGEARTPTLTALLQHPTIRAISRAIDQRDSSTTQPAEAPSPIRHARREAIIQRQRAARRRVRRS